MSDPAVRKRALVSLFPGLIHPKWRGDAIVQLREMDLSYYTGQKPKLGSIKWLRLDNEDAQLLAIASEGIDDLHQAIQEETRDGLVRYHHFIDANGKQCTYLSSRKRLVWWRASEHSIYQFGDRYVYPCCEQFVTVMEMTKTIYNQLNRAHLRPSISRRIWALVYDHMRAAQRWKASNPETWNAAIAHEDEHPAGFADPRHQSELMEMYRETVLVGDLRDEKYDLRTSICRCDALAEYYTQEQLQDPPHLVAMGVIGDYLIAPQQYEVVSGHFLTESAIFQIAVPAFLLPCVPHNRRAKSARSACLMD